MGQNINVCNNCRAAIPGTDIEGFAVTTELWIAGTTDLAHHSPIPDQDADTDGKCSKITPQYSHQSFSIKK